MRTHSQAKQHILVAATIILFSIAGMLLLSSSSAGPQDPNDPSYPLADTNGDYTVNIFDLSYMLARWGGTDSTADFTNDGNVNIFDLSYLLAQWGRVDVPPGLSNVQDTNYLQFDGVDDYVSLNNVDFPGSALTLEATVDLDSLDNCAAYDCRIIAKSTGTAEQDHYVMLSTINSGGDAVLRFRLKAGGTTETLVANSGILTGDTESRDTYHVAATYDGSTMRLFLDGVEVGSTAKTGSIDQGASIDTWIGGNPDGSTSRPWHGSIDEVRIWNVARTGAEIAGSREIELTGSESGLAHYYQFNAGSGQTVADSAGSNNTVLGSATGTDTNDPSVVVNVPDITPPSSPTGLSASNPTGNTIDLSWTASTDDQAVDLYRIYRDGVEVGSVSHPTTAFTDTSLTPLTTYSYEVYSVDTSANQSTNPSNTAQATTTAPDTTPPATPTGLTATAASSSTINLSWNQATDDVGVTAYVIDRDGADIATILEPTTTYQDSSLTADTTYTYTVRSTDAAGNHSPQSAPVNETTQTQVSACTWDGNPNNPTDDPNAPFDGTEGRMPVSTSQIPAGYPTPLTTGICAAGLSEGDLTPSGTLTITTDGTVIDGLDVNGAIIVRANNVTIRNTRITGSRHYTLELASGYSNLLVENTRVRAVGGTSSAVLFQGFATLRRVHITGGNDNFKAFNGVLVEDSYVAGVYKEPLTHNDVVQIRSGSNYTFRRNSMFGNWQGQTSVFLFQSKGGAISNVLVEDNYLSGGNYTIYTQQNNFPFTNGQVLNNRFELNSWQFGWSANSAGSNVIYSGNTQVSSP